MAKSVNDLEEEALRQAAMGMASIDLMILKGDVPVSQVTKDAVILAARGLAELIVARVVRKHYSETAKDKELHAQMVDVWEATFDADIKPHYDKAWKRLTDGLAEDDDRGSDDVDLPDQPEEEE